LPYHQGAKKTDSFRNPDGVVFKLQNLKKCATGRGLDHSSSTDKAVWEELGASPHQAHDLASLIRQAAKEIGDEPIKIEEFEFIEGRIVTAVHLRRERNPRVRDKFIESRRQSQSLNCDMCDAGSPALNPRYAAAHFETHHIVPLADAGERVTKPRDLALLCANCHRLLHRAIAQERRWLSVAEAKSICMV
jgi:5-methylcytosine-specific restriction protein A